MSKAPGFNGSQHFAAESDQPPLPIPPTLLSAPSGNYGIRAAGSAQSVAGGVLTWNNIGGGIQMGGGVMEVGAGVGVFLGGGPPGWVAGTVLILHGFDNIYAGFGTIYSGMPQNTLTYQAIAGAGQAAGLSENTSQWIAFIADAMLPTVVTGGVSLGQKLLQSGGRSVADDLSREIAEKIPGRPGTATTANNSLDEMRVRPVSGHTGFKESARLNRREILELRDDLATIGVKLERNADRILDRIGQNVRGGFDYESGTVYLRRGATSYEAFHEATHARQWANLGRANYVALGQFARERHVFQQVFANRPQFSRSELAHAVSYMRDIRSKFNAGLIE